MVRNKDARRYLREVRDLLPGAGKQKRNVLNRIAGTVVTILAENSDATYDDISSRLGSPNQIAAACLEELELTDVMKLLWTKKKIICTIAVAALAVVLLWAGVVFSAYEKHIHDMNGVIVESYVNESNIP